MVENAIRQSREIDNDPTVQHLAVLAMLAAGLLSITAPQV